MIVLHFVKVLHHVDEVFESFVEIHSWQVLIEDREIWSKREADAKSVCVGKDLSEDRIKFQLELLYERPFMMLDIWKVWFIGASLVV